VTTLRVLAGDLADVGPDALADLVRSVQADVVVLRGGPRRLRWRTRTADLAHRCGLVYAGGGEPALGNVILVGLRVAVRESWCVQFPLGPGRLMYGAVLVRARLAGTDVVLAGTRLSPYPDERAGQAATVARVLAETTGATGAPVVVAADVADARTSSAWRILADGRVEADPTAEEPTDAIFVDPSVIVSGARRIPAQRGRITAVVDLELRGAQAGGETSQ
jgi:endonuclease/exonuclease/phosphatase family metal-dependent hydrolase